MRILLVGSLSWNPERMLSLREQGHELYGLWGRSMGWDQGPYPVLDGAVASVAPAQAESLIRERGIECVYGLYQEYPRAWWGPPQPGVEHDQGTWDLLRRLVIARSRGAIDVPIVRHYGFDVLELDPAVMRSLDGHVVCNEQKLRYWTASTAEGGCGIEALGDPSLVTFLDGDLPKAEFMGDDFAQRLSDRDGGIHTVCIGRPVGIDVLAAAQRGIHVHVHGNAFDDVHARLAAGLPPDALRRHRELLARHLHVHPSLQTIGASDSLVRRAKSGWVETFSRYDAGWSYIGTPNDWEPLDERAAIPNRLSTCLLAGLPVITDEKPGHYRFDLLEKLGVGVVLGDAGYDGLRGELLHEISERARSARARAARHSLSFDAGIPRLVDALERARERYLARPLGERIRFEDGERIALYRPPREAPDASGKVSGPIGAWRARRERRRRRRQRRDQRKGARRLAAMLESAPVGGAGGSPPAAGGVRRVAVIERFDAPSRRCDALAAEPSTETVPFELHQVRWDRAAHAGGLVAAGVWWLSSPFRVRHPLRLLRACWQARHVRLGALRWVPEIARRARRGGIDELACFSSKGMPFVPLLAQELGLPLRELLDRETRYFGEFAYEMLAIVPYAYWLHQQGRLERTTARPDTRCLYYFSEDHREVPGERGFVPMTEYPVGEIGDRRFDSDSFPVHLDTSRWSPPPYAERFRDPRFLWTRPTCVICNKTSEENYLGEARVNSIDTDLLLALIERLRKRFQVVYDRPRSVDIVNDHQRVGDLGEIEEVVRRHPDVLTIQQLHARHPELSFNELQLRVFAGCRRFVSVVGGSSYLASWFGGTNVVYARGGWEVDCGAFEGWFGAFSGARVVAVSTPEALLAAVDRELLAAPSSSDGVLSMGEGSASVRRDP